jgi:hypothetical protein
LLAAAIGDGIGVNSFVSEVTAINVSGNSTAVVFLNVFSGDGTFIEFSIQSDKLCGELPCNLG